jgi:ABC-type sugar transport system ATPase subunit
MYGATAALIGVSVSVKAGTIHALVGHNGSGKSTLVKLLSGYDFASSGTITWDGSPIQIGEGVPAVHQSLGLSLDLTALENFGVSSGYGASRLGLVNWSQERRRFKEYSEQIDVRIDPTALVRELPPVERASLAMVRCLRRLDEQRAKSRFLLLDEITTFYSEGDREKVADLARRLTRQGAGLLFISHYLDEVLRLADVVSVLKTGRLVGTYPTADIDKQKLIHLMFDVPQTSADRSEEARKASATPQKWHLGPVLNYEVYAGEILGLSGRVGMGHEEVPYDLHRRSNELRPGTNGKRPILRLVPADRGRNGIWVEGTVTENLTLSTLARHCWRAAPIMKRREERRFADHWIADHGVRAPGIDAPMAALSGGNQQKILVGRSLLALPEILVLHEPTQGIDALARKDILNTVRAVARAGTSIVLVSSEYEDLTEVCDRVLIFHEGVPRAQLVRGEFDVKTIAAAV